MNRYLKIILAVVLFAALGSGMSFAVTFSDSDVTPVKLQSGNWTWTHILDLNEFNPALNAGDTINVTDALLTIQLDFIRYNPPGAGLKLFEVNGSGDNILLATLDSNGSAGTVNNFIWQINFNDDVLHALDDRSLAVTLSLVANHGTIGNIDSSILTGGADVTAAASAVPEPSTFILLGAGLAGVGILRRRFKK